MRRENGGMRIDTVMVLAIFCVFAISVLAVLALSANVYKSTVGVTDEGYEEQTCISYIWTKVKANDLAGRVYVEKFGDRSALCIEEEYDGVVYKTLIYQYDGWIRELFFESGLEFSPGDGLGVIEGDSLKLESIGEGLIKATAGGESIILSLRSKTGERSRME